jgi:hypothetical protein
MNNLAINSINGIKCERYSDINDAIAIINNNPELTGVVCPCEDQDTDDDEILNLTWVVINKESFDVVSQLGYEPIEWHL